MSKFKRNHYVPQWYQRRFIPEYVKEEKFYYLDMKPEKRVSNGKVYFRSDLLRWGPAKCFYETDLYTTKFDRWESTEIEQEFFGKVDSSGLPAVEYFSNFVHPSVNSDALHALLPYMSIQKLRTPKGLGFLASQLRSNSKNEVLYKMQELQEIYCATWTECIWSIVDASQSGTKFLLSDHPVTVYNKGCFPGSAWCKGYNDPDIRLSGTHTIFPLCLDKALILTNLSWLRNPHKNPLKPRPNPNFFRAAMFNFTEIQTRRFLSELEVIKINYIIKMRALRYVAAVSKEWLYPEYKANFGLWNKLGDEYLLMPDPRSSTFSSEIVVGYGNGKADAFDEYGRKPWHSDYKEKKRYRSEWESFLAFQGEYARKFGPKRKGVAFKFNRLDNLEDSPEYHKYHLNLENRKKSKWRKKR